RPDPLAPEHHRGAGADHDRHLRRRQRRIGREDGEEHPDRERQDDDGRERADRALHRPLTLTRGSIPSSSPFMTGCWLPPTARDFVVTCCSMYSYSSCWLTMPSWLPSAAPLRPSTGL